MVNPVIQTRVGGNLVAPGNCFAACIAAILGVSLEDVPDEVELINRTKRHKGEGDSQFYQRCWGKYWVELSTWLRDRFGLGMMELDPKCFHGTGLLCDDDAYMIASGKSPRGLEHCVICKGMDVVHDPHPDGGGLVNETNEWRWILFVVLDPSKRGSG